MKLLASAVLLAAALALAGAAHAGDLSPDSLCVSVEAPVPDPRFLDCLSKELNTSVARGDDARRAREAVAAARTPRDPAEQGLYTQAATRLRLGQNFGHSVVPYRPTVEYQSPLIPPAASPAP